MSTPVIVALAVVAVLVLWVLGAYNRLVRHRNAVLKAFGMLHEQLTRRHRQVHDLVARATDAAAGDPRVRLQSIAATHEAARTAADYAKAAPIDAARVSIVDRAEVALSHRLGRFIASLAAAPTCRDDDELHRMRQDIVRGASQLEFATQAFNHAVLAYNRAAREAPTHVVATLFGFGDAAVVSPGIAKLPERHKKAHSDGAPVEAGDTHAASKPGASLSSPETSRAHSGSDERAAADRAAAAGTPDTHAAQDHLATPEGHHPHRTGDRAAAP